MKATIGYNGELIINAENTPEGYALTKWIEENYNVKGIVQMLAPINCKGKFEPSKEYPFNITINALPT